MSIRLNAAAGLLAASAVGLLPAAATAQTKLLRFPDIAGDRVAFCYAGDIWTAPGEGRQRHAAHGPPRPRALPEVLAGREVDRLHRPVRGRRAGLRDPGRGRAAEAAHLLPRPRPLRPAPRLRQPGRGLDAGRRVDRLPLAARRRRHPLGGHPLHRPREGRPREGPAHAHLGRGRLLARRQADRLLAPLPRLPHLEALRGRLGAGPLRLRPRHERREAVRRRACAPSATRCGSATPSTSPPTATARSTSTPGTRRPTRSRSSRAARRGTCAGRPPTTRRASSTS